MVEQMCNSPEMTNVESREIGCEELTYSHEVFLIGQPETTRVYLKVQLNGKVARGLLDTGSERNILHESLLSKYFGPKPELRGPISRLTALGGIN